MEINNSQSHNRPHQVIIPVAGAGTRLRPFTYNQPKALIPVAGKPIICYIVDELIQNGITEFIFVVGYLGEKIVDFISNHYPNLNSHFVHQVQRDGLGHALHLCQPYVNSESDLIIQLGDSIVDISPDFFSSDVHTNLIATKKVADPQNFGLVELGEDKSIKQVVEKPKFPMSNLAMVGLYRIRETHKLFEVLDVINKDDIRTNGEIQFTEAIQRMINDGVWFDHFEAIHWLDVGKTDVLLQSNSILLQKFGNQIDPTAQILNSVIIEPVSIAANTKIVNSIVGPNVTIGDHSIVNDSILNNGILGDFSRLKNMQLTQFVIGSDSSLLGSLKSLSVGDNTEIDFSHQ